MTINLSDQQREIVEADPDRSIKVLASAGSGKTRVLTERIRFLLGQRKEMGVIALTFTNKAASEMSERLQENGIDSSRIWVGTVHSFAQRILDQYGHTVGLPDNVQIYERDQDRMDVFLEALKTDGVNIEEYLNVEDQREKRDRTRNLQNYMDGFSIIKRELLSEESVAERLPDLPDVWRVYNDYQRSLSNSGGIDYDDILRNALEVLLTQPWVGEIYRSKFGYLCVDEAQDLNRIQYEFIKALAGSETNRVMMVGDPDQMIYGFTGSSSEFLSGEFQRDFEPIVFRLIENYRSSKAIIRAANGLRPGAQNETKFAHEGIATVNSFASEEEEASWIVASVKNFLEVGKHPEIESTISLSNMVVIARNRFVFAKLEDELKNQEIEYNLKIGERAKTPISIFGQVLDSAIRIKLNPKDWIDGRKLCQLLEVPVPPDWGQTDFLTNLKIALQESSNFNRSLISKLLDQVSELSIENPNILKFEAFFESEISNFAISATDEQEILEYSRSLEELKDFSNSWSRFRQLGLGNSLSGFRNAAALGKLNQDEKHSGLTLSTVHTMKGLEKDIVFLMGFCEGVFPDYRATTISKIEEEKNTAFVAVTRARRWLYVSYPQTRMMPWGGYRQQSPSRFIAQMGLSYNS